MYSTRNAYVGEPGIVRVDQIDLAPIRAFLAGASLPLRGRAPADVLAALGEYVEELEAPERFLLIKLIGGGFRVGVSRLLVTRALAEHSGVDAKLIAQRMIGYTDIKATPTAQRYLALIDAGDEYASSERASVHGRAACRFRQAGAMSHDWHATFDRASHLADNDRQQTQRAVTWQTRHSWSGADGTGARGLRVGSGLGVR